MDTDRCSLSARSERRALRDDAVRRVALLRHGEKEGRESRARLSSTGRMRAFALPHLLLELSRREGWPVAPDCLIAAHDRTDSVRPSETLQHLAHRLSLRVHHCRTPQSVKAVLFESPHAPTWRHAVVVWRHDALLDVARALGASAAALPSDWPDDLYDRLILLDYDAQHSCVDVRCVYTDADLHLTGDPPRDGQDAERAPSRRSRASQRPDARADVR